VYIWIFKGIFYSIDSLFIKNFKKYKYMFILLS